MLIVEAAWRHATAVVEPQSGRPTVSVALKSLLPLLIACPGRLTFLYALADGAADQSYGRRPRRHRSRSLSCALAGHNGPNLFLFPFKSHCENAEAPL